MRGGRDSVTLTVVVVTQHKRWRTAKCGGTILTAVQGDSDTRA